MIYRFSSSRVACFIYRPFLIKTKAPVHRRVGNAGKLERVKPQEAKE
jgi:hypothetical protein